MLEGLMGGVSQVPKASFLSNVAFPRAALGELFILLGHPPHLQAQLLPIFFVLSCWFCSGVCVCVIVEFQCVHNIFFYG